MAQYKLFYLLTFTYQSFMHMDPVVKEETQLS